MPLQYRSRDVSTTLHDMGIKGFAYPAHHRQKQTLHINTNKSEVTIFERRTSHWIQL